MEGVEALIEAIDSCEQLAKSRGVSTVAGNHLRSMATVYRQRMAEVIDMPGVVEAIEDIYAVSKGVEAGVPDLASEGRVAMERLDRVRDWVVSETGNFTDRTGNGEEIILNL